MPSGRTWATFREGRNAPRWIQRLGSLYTARQGEVISLNPVSAEFECCVALLRESRHTTKWSQTIASELPTTRPEPSSPVRNDGRQDLRRGALGRETIAEMIRARRGLLSSSAIMLDQLLISEIIPQALKVRVGIQGSEVPVTRFEGLLQSG